MSRTGDREDFHKEVVRKINDRETLTHDEAIHLLRGFMGRNHAMGLAGLEIRSLKAQILELKRGAKVGS